MIEGIVVFLIVAVAVVFAARTLFTAKGDDGTCSGCEVKPDKR